MYRPPPPKRAGSKPDQLDWFDVKQPFQTAMVDVAGSGPSIFSLKFEQLYKLSPRRIGTQSQIVSNRPVTVDFLWAKGDRAGGSGRNSR